MLTASEANEQAKININNCVTEELSSLEKQINKAVANGKFSIANNGYLQPETKQRL